MKAVLADAVGRVSVHDVPRPVLKVSEILVKVTSTSNPTLRLTSLINHPQQVKAVAINPSGWSLPLRASLSGAR